jgi:Domain of unknown function (DUF2382)/PRC-barrel domain
MASVRLSQSPGYRLLHREQDWRGWDVRDAAGNPLGRVTDFIIDTDASTAVELVLDNGAVVAIDDVLVEQQSLTVWGGAPSRGAAPSLQLFEQGTLDVIEQVERAVLTKRLIVIEELVISHDVIERTARIQATLRRVDVDVERMADESGTITGSPG